MKKKTIIVYLAFMCIMIGLGASDSMRGIFSEIFEEHFSLSKSQVSMVITVSYIGNLVFMLFGSRMADRFDKKKVCIGILILWMAALLFYVATDHYVCLLVGMFVSMGASTLMNTMINILSTPFFGISAGMIVNTLFFTQGIGTSASQNFVGRFASNYGHFRLVNLILLALGVVGTVLLFGVEFPKGISEKQQSGKEIEKIYKSRTFLIFTLIFGFYFIAEHGILNWWKMYCSQEAGLSVKDSAMYHSLFFGGMTVGRLVFSPLVSKLGEKNSILYFGGAGAVFYIAGIVCKDKALALVSVAGLFLSIIYPTLVLLLRHYFKPNVIAGATGAVISAATLFDIGFNAVFGKIVDTVGFGRGIMIFPVSMAGFYLLYVLYIKSAKKQEVNTNESCNGW